MDYTYANLFKYFRHFLKPYSKRLVLASCAQFISSVVLLYTAYAFAELVNFINTYESGDSLRSVYVLLTLWGLSLILRQIFVYYARINTYAIGERAGNDIEVYALKHLSSLDISWHEKENAGNKLKRIQHGGSGIRELTRIWVLYIIDIVVNFVGTLIIISHFDKTLSLMLIGYLVSYFLIATSFRKKAVTARHKKNIKEEIYTGIIFEQLNNIRSVKVLGMIKPLMVHIKQIASEYIIAVERMSFWFQTGSFARGIWEGIVRIGFSAYVIYGIVQGHYELGFFILFYGYQSTLNGSINELSSITQEVAVAKANLGRLGDILDTPIVIDSEKGKENFPGHWNTISLKNLSFSYGDANALSNISFEIKRGEKIGIVGLSGAGKSTLFKLLLKEHEATDGDIYFDNTPLKQIKKSDYLKYVAAVLQETEVFNMPLRQNILLANMNAEHDTMLFNKSVNTSHVKDFLNKLPSGIDSVIGEKGVKLSGGEKQRVGIARAIFKDPQILLLDEATSHLDVESEGKIKDSLHQFFQNITAIVIAHRLSTIKEMDKIIVIEGGRIIESGTFDELYKKDKRFREFWDKQALQA